MQNVSFTEATKKGIQLVLTDGSPPNEAGSTERNVPGTPLDDAATEALLKRAEPLEGEDDDRRTFVRPAETLKPPLTGSIEAIDPPSVQLPTPEVDDGPARVLRAGPEGEVPQAPKLSITFSKPMVAVSSQQVTQETVPVVLEPQPEGQWRWLGTRTLVFEPERRFPMATSYTVTLRDSAHTATGETVEAHSFSFATPPPRLVGTAATPHESTNPVVSLTFDQPVDPEVVRAHLQTRPEAALHLATPAEIADRPTSDRIVHLAFDAPLTVDTAYTVTLPPGLVGLEGPRPTEDTQKVTFRTHGALTLSSGCERRRCSPSGPLFIEASNPLDAEAFEQGLVTLDPPVEGLHTAVSWRNLSIHGKFAPRTTYTATVRETLQDTHGQQLGRAQTVKLTTGDVDPWFRYGAQRFVVLDPGTSDPSLTVTSAGLDGFDVWIKRVEPSDLPEAYQYNGAGTGPGELLLHERIAVAEPDAVTDSRIALAPHLADGIGQLMVEVRAKKGKREWDGRSWVQGTRIGVDAFLDRDTLWASATDLATGRALDGVEVQLGDRKGTTDARGLVSFPLQGHPEASHLVASKGGDQALLPASRWGMGRWEHHTAYTRGAWFVFDDRGLYKPGEEVRVHGLQRLIDPGPEGDVRAPEAKRVEWVAHGPRNNELAKGTAKVGSHGDFELSFTLPEGVNLGWGHLRLTSSDGHGTSHRFQIQEFRRPEFEVGATVSEGPHVLGEHATASVTASYYAGGGLAGAEVRWWADGDSTTYRPPGNEGFSFGAWSPWWWYGGFGGDSGERYSGAQLTGTTDGAGVHHLDVHFAAGEPKPMNVALRASVVDVNRQQFTANTSTLVHPSERYVGLAMDKAFVRQGEPLKVQVVATDIDGARQAASVQLVAVREQWRFTKGQWRAEEAERHECTVETGSDPVLCTIEPEEPGRFTLTATVRDAEGRANETELNAWVAGGKSKPTRRVELEQVTLIPDADTYAPGDTAEVFVQAPFAPADAVVNIDRDGFVEVRHLKLEEPTAVISVPIDGAMTPGVHVQVEITGSAQRIDDQGDPLPVRRPAFASGSIHLPIPPLHRTLDVQVKPRAAGLRPGAETAVDVKVTSAAGTPVADAAVTLWAVDEAVLTLGGYQLGDPLAPFYSQRGTAVRAERFRDLLVLAEPEEVLEQLGYVGSAAGGGGVGLDGAMSMNADKASSRGRPMAKMAPGSPPPPPPPPPAEPSPEAESQASGPIEVRTDFRALAFWRGEGRTDASGALTVSYTLPDSLTRYRILAVASDDAQQFGKGEANVTARNPLMIRPSPPRFLNFGDRFELPIVLQNQTDAAMKVQVALQASNAVFLDALDQPGEPYEVGSMATGRTVEVPANDRVELRIPTATDMAGTARFQVVASSADFADAARFELPVYTPATSEAFATYGVIDQGAIRQPISTPGEVWTQFGGLDVDTSSTALQALTDAVIQLTDYPYGCSEQVASRVLALVALRDVLTAFESDDLPPPEALKAQLDQDLARLAELQNPDGGFGFWRKGEESWPYVSLHVAHAVGRALEKGVDVPTSLRDGSLRYLKNTPGNLRHRYLTESTRRHLHAYAISIGRLYGLERASEAEALLKHDLRLEAKGWLLPTLHAAKSARVPELLREIGNRTDETAGNAHFVASYDEQDAFVVLASDRRLDGVLLDALIQVDRDNDLVPKVASGLLAHRVRGHWGSTQENAFVLLALDRYFRTYENVTPDFVARAWLGDLYAGQAAFEGREVDTRRIHVPMGELTEDPSRDLILQKQGDGRLYYRIGLRYAPKSLQLEPADYGFTVQRRYEAIDDPADVRFEDGVWHVKKGANVRVVVEMAADARRYHVALADPLPAGFEPLNPELNGASPVTEQAFTSDDGGFGRSRPWWWGRWYVHDNLRDQRAEAFAHIVYGGLYTYSYVARATTPGSFVVPPAKAEEMYHPETFGRSATTRVNID